MASSTIPPPTTAPTRTTVRELTYIDPARARGQPAMAWLYVALLVLVALAGGSSRADSLAQPIVRVGAILLVAAMAMFGRVVEWRSLRLPLLFCATLVTVAVIILLPLPPSLWMRLPGRALIAQAAPLAGIAQPWRPIALVPPLAMNALMALVPPLAALVGLCYLTAGQRARMLSPVVILIIASAFLGLAQVTTGSLDFDREQSAGFFANRNHQALLLAIGLPMLAVWATATAVRRPSAATRPWMATGAGVFLLLAIPATGSRAGLVLGAAGVAAAVALSFAAARRGLNGLPRRWRTASLVAAIAGAALVLTASLTFGQAISVQRAFALDVGADTRTRALPTLRAMVIEFFPVGTGFGGFEPMFRAAEPRSLLRLTYFNQAHNDILQIVVEAGLVGAVLLAVFVLWWLVRTFALWRMSAALPHVRLGRAGSVAVALTLMASVVDYPVRTPLIMVVVVIACGWMQLPQYRSSQSVGALRADASDL